MTAQTSNIKSVETLSCRLSRLSAWDPPSETPVQSFWSFLWTNARTSSPLLIVPNVTVIELAPLYPLLTMLE